MATPLASPYGLRPVKRVDGLPYAGAISEFEINPAGHANNIFNGSIVALDTNGYITLMTATGADAAANAFPAGTIGVAVGFEFVNAQGQLLFSQYYPAGYAAPAGSKIKVKVVADPDVLFQGQMDGVAAQASIGANTFLAAGQTSASGNVRTGNSNAALESTVVATAAGFRVVAILSPFSDNFADVLVKFNPGQHSYLNAVGI
jgi:hypothetical protein